MNGFELHPEAYDDIDEIAISTRDSQPPKSSPALPIPELIVS